MQNKTTNQLKRIQGQVNGIVTMYEEDRSCVDIVRQILAVRQSLSTVARNMLTDEAERCSHERRIEDLDAILKEIFRY